MPLSIRQLEQQVQHALGGRLSPELDLMNLINEAGSYFMSMRSWNFASRPPAPCDFKNGQTYVNLPLDVGEIVQARLTTSLVGSFTLTTLDEIVLYRTSFNLPLTGTYWGALVWYQAPSLNGAPGGPPKPRLEIAPTPVADSIGGLTLEYRGAWRIAAGDQEYANVPQYAESLLKQVVRAYAQGYEEDNQASLSARLTEIEAGPLFMNAAREDGKQVGPLGPPRGGAAAQQMLHRWSLPFWPAKIGP